MLKPTEKYRGWATFTDSVFMGFLLNINRSSRCSIGYNAVWSKTLYSLGGKHHFKTIKGAMEAQKRKKENSDWGTQMSWKSWCLSWTTRNRLD